MRSLIDRGHRAPLAPGHMTIKKWLDANMGLSTQRTGFMICKGYIAAIDAEVERIIRKSVERCQARSTKVLKGEARKVWMLRGHDV